MKFVSHQSFVRACLFAIAPLAFASFGYGLRQDGYSVLNQFTPVPDPDRLSAFIYNE